MTIPYMGGQVASLLRQAKKQSGLLEDEDPLAGAPPAANPFQARSTSPMGDPNHAHRSGLLGTVQHALGTDRIAPELASLLTPEQAQRVRPGGLLGELGMTVLTGKGAQTRAQEKAMNLLGLQNAKTARDKQARDQRVEQQIQAVAGAMEPQAGAEYAARMRLMYGLGEPQSATATAALRPDPVKILGPQSVAIDPVSGETVASAPEDVEDVRDYLGGKAKFKNGVFASWVLRPPSERDTTTGDALAAQREYQRVQGLRDDYASNPTIKRAAEYASAYQGIVAASQSDDPQTSLAMMYEAVKMRDPNAVREGELALQRSARSVPQWMYGLWEKASKGNVLTPVEKRQILAWAREKIVQQDRVVRPIQSEFGAAARRFGVQADSSFIAPSPFAGTGLEARPSAAPAAGGKTFTDPVTGVTYRIP